MTVSSAMGRLTRALPHPRGPLSETVTTALARPPADESVPPPPVADQADPYGEDLALALYTCYELHYRGFDGVDPGWEWQPELLRFRAVLERVFLAALRCDTHAATDTCTDTDTDPGTGTGSTNVTAALEELLVEPASADGLSHYLRDGGQWWQVREYLAHRSVYHLKEADPHAWVIPRLHGQAKASLVAVEFDEFGGGRGECVHAQLFADLLVAAGLSADYLYYLDDVPAPALAIVNMMSMFGLHRRLRGALVGHFAAAEISTAPSAARITEGLRRLGAGPDCTRFFTEHVHADAVHEQVLRHDVIVPMLRREPELAADVVFGIAATELLEERFARHLLTSWRQDRTSLRRPLPDAPPGR